MTDYHDAIERDWNAEQDESEHDEASDTTREDRERLAADDARDRKDTMTTPSDAAKKAAEDEIQGFLTNPQYQRGRDVQRLLDTETDALRAKLLELYPDMQPSGMCLRHQNDSPLSCRQCYPNWRTLCEEHAKVSEALLADKERLDWLEKQKSCRVGTWDGERDEPAYWRDPYVEWIVRRGQKDGTGGVPKELKAMTVRSAIDAARKEQP